MRAEYGSGENKHSVNIKFYSRFTEKVGYSEERKEIQELYNIDDQLQMDFKRLEELGVVLIKKVELGSYVEENCYYFIFGKGSNEDHIKTMITEFKIGTKEPGAIAAYFDKNIVVHVGRVDQEGKVISKWGTGHVFKHEVNAVPSSFGDRVVYFKK